MKCDSCDERAVISRKHEGRYLCDEHFTRDINKKVRRTIRKGDMIESGDRIAVALSGGKDSSLVLYTLKDIIGERRDIDLFALAIDEGIEGYREESLEMAKELCQDLDVDLHIISYRDEIGDDLDDILEKKEDAGACTYCGVFRRELMNRWARKLDATKVATGHNLDDELQSVFMNYLNGDISRLVRMRDNPSQREEGFIPRIKPLRKIPEREVGLFCILNGIEVHEDECPNAQDSVRFDVREFLNEMEDRYPGTKFTAMAMFEKMLPPLQEEYLEDIPDLNECGECGEPCSGETCKACQLKATI